MADIDWLVKFIEVNVRAGHSPDQACKLLNQQFPADWVRAARAQYEKKAGRIRSLKEPPSLEEEDLPVWYTGPDPEDRFWPPLRTLLLTRPDWTPEAVESLDRASSKVISLLQPPGIARFDTLGASIPGDVAIRGFDDQEVIAPYLRPPLSTSALPHYEMGQWAVRYVLERAEHGQDEKPIQHTMHCPLVERAST